MLAEPFFTATPRPLPSISIVKMSRVAASDFMETTILDPKMPGWPVISLITALTNLWAAPRTFDGAIPETTVPRPGARAVDVVQTKLNINAPPAFDRILHEPEAPTFIQSAQSGDKRLGL